MNFQLRNKTILFSVHFPPIFRHFTDSVTFSVTKIFPPPDIFIGHFWEKWRKNLTHGHYVSGALKISMRKTFLAPHLFSLLFTYFFRFRQGVVIIRWGLWKKFKYVTWLTISGMLRTLDKVPELCCALGVDEIAPLCMPMFNPFFIWFNLYTISPLILPTILQGMIFKIEEIK